MASIGGNNRGIVGGADLQRTVDSLNRAIQGLTNVTNRLPSGMQSLLSTVNTGSRIAQGARHMVQDVFQGPRGDGKGYRYNWGNVGGNVSFNGGQNGNNNPNVIRGQNGTWMRTPGGGYLNMSPGASGTPSPVMGAGSPNGGGATFGGRPASGSGGGPPIDLSGMTSIGKGFSGAVSSMGALGAGLASGGAGSDWAIRRMMMSNRQSWNANSNYAFGPNTGLGGWNSIATSTDDVAAAMMIGQNVSGSSLSRTGANYKFMTGAAGLAYGNPTLSATGAAQYTAGMYSPRGVMMSAAYGIPSISQSGQRMTPGQQASMLLSRTGMGNASISQIDTGLRTGYGLDVSANTLGNAMGVDPDILKQQLRSQTAIAKANGINVSAAGTVLERASQGDKAAVSQVRKGLGDEQSSSILQSMKTADAASRKTDQQIMAEFSKALTGATDIINKFTANVNDFLKSTGLDKAMGWGAAVSTTMKSAASGPLGPLGIVPGLVGAWGNTPFWGNQSNAVGGGAAPVSTSPSKNGSTAGKGATPSAGSSAQKFIDAAKKYLGQPYVFGALDCSGLVQYAYKSVTGKSLPHRATSQYYMGKQVPKGQEQPGDTVYWDARTGRAGGNPTGGKGYKHHTAIYLGGGKIIAAPQTGENVKIQGLYGDYEFARLPGIGGVVMGGSQNFSGSDKDTKQDNQGGDTGAGGAVALGALGDVYGSINEYDALSVALAAMGANGDQPQNSTKSSQTDKPVGSPTGDSGAITGPASIPANSNKGQLQSMVKNMMKGMGWGSDQYWNDVNYIVEHESSWNPKSVNSIGAYGLFQAYPGNKMAAFGKDWKTNPVTQTKFGLNYIKSRYGNPDKAHDFWTKNRWYDQGAWEINQTQTALVHQGEMILDKKNAETVRQALIKNNIPSANSAGGSGGVNIVFEKGAINLNNNAAVMTDEHTRNLARQISQSVAENDRIRTIARGR